MGPYKSKKTLFRTLVPDTLWTLDQKFGILNVQVPIRTTVIALKSGGLFVYNPVAATPEVVSFLRDLETKHGPVTSIVVASVAAEHKVYASVLAQKFAKATVYLTAGQYSFPLDLPASFLGYPSERTRRLSSDTPLPVEWKDDLEFKILGPIISRDGAFAEAVFYHRATKSLLVTDTVVEVTDDPPKIYDLDPAPLLFHARDTVDEVVEDTPEVRRRGWRRVVLFGLFFQPSAIRIKDPVAAVRERRVDVNGDFAGIYPWDWVGDDVASFRALEGGLLVAPILQKLLLNRSPVEVLDFADSVAKWDIKRIVPSHFLNDLKYDGKAYRDAFNFLEVGGRQKGLPKPLDADFQTLNDAEVNLIASGAISKAPPMVGGSVSRVDIIAQTAYKCRGDVCAPKASP